MKPIPVKLDEQLLARITKMSEKMGEAKSTVMRIAMRVGLEVLEKSFQDVGTKYPPHRSGAMFDSATKATPMEDSDTPPNSEADEPSTGSPIADIVRRKHGKKLHPPK